MASSPSFDVLVVDDEPNIRRTLSIYFEGRGHRAWAVATPEEALREAAQRPFDLAFVDVRLGTASGLDLLPRLAAERPDLRIVVITAYASVETAVEAMKRGARDYLPKPFTPAQLDLVLEKMTALDGLERKVRVLEGDLAQAEPEPELESSSPSMQEVIRMARQVADSDARLLLRGESGTGKGIVARAIHRWSARRDRPFVIVPCPALPAELLESELFGHVKGAFTGATRDNPGRVALAQGGTLMLDEIGDLPPALQPKLLRFIQDREYERVGDPAVRRADVRILGATNRDLEAAVREGRFREDLFYRLNVVTLEIPPLRDRREDVLPLAEHFLAFFSRRYHRAGLRFSSEAVRLLLGYGWPGNVRELRNAVERATMLAQGEEVGPGALLAKAPVPASGVAVGDPVPLAEIEQEHIRRVLARSPSLKEAAEILGIDQATLWRRRRQYGL